MISNTRKSTPRLAIEIMYGRPPLDVIITQEAISSIARNRLVMIRDWPGHNKKYRTLIGHTHFWEQKAKELRIKLDDSNSTKLTHWVRHFTVNTDSFKDTGPPIHSQVNIYTDGSKTDEHVGCGFVIYCNNEEIAIGSTKLEDEITVY